MDKINDKILVNRDILFYITLNKYHVGL